MGVVFTANNLLSTTNPVGAGGAYTWAAWAYPTVVGVGLDADVIYANGVTGTTSARQITVTGSNWNFEDRGVTGSPSNFQRTTPATANVWAHVAMTFDGTTHFAYLNGVQVGTSAVSTGGIAATYLEAGGAGTGDPWNSQIQDLFFFERALSPHELAWLMRTRVPRNTANLVAWWPIRNVATGGVDYSGHGNTLTQSGTLTTGTQYPPVGLGAPTSDPILPAATGAVIVAAGSTASAGTAAMTAATALTAAGSTASAGAATMTIAAAFAAGGGTASAGAAAMTVATAIAAAGATATAGSATVASSTALAANGTTASAGTAALATQMAFAAAGSTASAGAATVTVVAGGTTVSFAADGGTASAGSATLLSATALGAAGSTASAGTATPSVATAFASAGTTASAGSATMTQLTALGAAGSTASAGSATVLLSTAFTAAGGTATSGIATVTGGAPAPPGDVGGGGQFDPRNRLNARRPTRR